jgi:hypothetical protein
MKTKPTARHSVFRSAVCCLVAVCLSGFTSPGKCHAQNGEDIAKGLLRALIESQLDKSRRRSDGPSTQLNPAPGNVTREMQQLRSITAGISQEYATLGALLQTESRRNFEVRRHLPDALRLQAEATALTQRVASQRNHILMIDDFRSLNNGWKMLSHQLEQCRNLSPQIAASIKRIDVLDAQYCSVLGIQSQYNSQELTQAAYTLTTYMHDLIEDVQHSTPFPQGSNRQFMRELGRVSQLVEQFAGLVSEGAQYDAIVTEYKRLYENWLGIETKLTGYSSHGVTRNMRRIREVHQTLHQLLRLELGVDKHIVLHFIHEVDNDLNELYRTITLEHLIALPDGAAVPEAADILGGTIQNIDDLVHRDQNAQVIAEAWVYTDEAWNKFAFYLSSTSDTAIASRLKSIDETLTSLQQALGVTIRYDQRALVKGAESLEHLSEELATSLKRWQAGPGKHDRSLPSKAEKMASLFHHIEQSIAAGRIGEHNLQECDAAITNWQQIRPVLKTCDTPERNQLDQIAATFTTEILRLRTMLDGQ